MNNTQLSAVLLLVMTGLIGGLTYMLSGDEPIDVEARPVRVAEVSPKTVEVIAMTPKERMLKGRLEAELREIEEYRKKGTVLPNGEIKVTDVDGEPLYIHPELIEGVGRYGEPLYATVKYKKRAAVPLAKEIKSKLPEKAQPKLLDARDKKIITFGTKPTGDDGEMGPPASANAGAGATKGEKGAGKGKSPKKGG